MGVLPPNALASTRVGLMLCWPLFLDLPLGCQHRIPGSQAIKRVPNTGSPRGPGLGGIVGRTRDELRTVNALTGNRSGMERLYIDSRLPTKRFCRKYF